jgi:hypothetical protein
MLVGRITFWFLLGFMGIVPTRVDSARNQSNCPTHVFTHGSSVHPLRGGVCNPPLEWQNLNEHQ